MPRPITTTNKEDMANTNFIGFIISFVVVIGLGISSYWAVVENDKDIHNTYANINTTVTET
jgi:hypothetical protein